MMGWTNEDHLAAIAVNAEFLMHYEKMIELGQLPASLNDLPQYEKQFVCPAGWKIAYLDNPRSGWWVCKLRGLNHSYSARDEYLRKDGQLHISTGGGETIGYKYGEAPGYWPTKEEAEAALAAYLEKQK